MRLGTTLLALDLQTSNMALVMMEARQMFTRLARMRAGGVYLSRSSYWVLTLKI